MKHLCMPDNTVSRRFRWSLILKVGMPLFVIFFLFFVPVVKTRYNQGQWLSVGFFMMNKFFQKQRAISPEWFKKEWLECKHNSECGVVPSYHCGCSAGGTNIAINKKWMNRYFEERAENENTCVDIISNDPSCFAKDTTCRFGKCRLK